MVSFVTISQLLSRVRVSLPMRLYTMTRRCWDAHTFRWRMGSCSILRSLVSRFICSQDSHITASKIHLIAAVEVCSETQANGCILSLSSQNWFPSHGSYFLLLKLCFPAAMIYRIYSPTINLVIILFFLSKVLCTRGSIGSTDWSYIIRKHTSKGYPHPKPKNHANSSALPSLDILL